MSAGKSVLLASVRIVDRSGNVVRTWELTSKDFSSAQIMDRDPAGPFPAFRFSPVPPDDYEIDVNVYKLAAKLVETPHHVIAKYELCGIERYPAVVAGLLSAFCFLVGGIMAAAAWWPRRAALANKSQDFL